MKKIFIFLIISIFALGMAHAQFDNGDSDDYSNEFSDDYGGDFNDDDNKDYGIEDIEEICEEYFDGCEEECDEEDDEECTEECEDYYDGCVEEGQRRFGVIDDGSQDVGNIDQGGFEVDGTGDDAVGPTRPREIAPDRDPREDEIREPKEEEIQDLPDDLPDEELDVPDENDIDFLLGAVTSQGGRFRSGGYTIPLGKDEATSAFLQIIVEEDGSLEVEIKDTVDAASEEIIEVTIEGGNYVIDSVVEGKLFWFIPISMPVSRKIDRDSLEVIEEDRPWYDFLVRV